MLAQARQVSAAMCQSAVVAARVGGCFVPAEVEQLCWLAETRRVLLEVLLRFVVGKE